MSTGRQQRKVPIEFWKPNPRTRADFFRCRTRRARRLGKQHGVIPADRGGARSRALRIALNHRGERRWRAANSPACTSSIVPIDVSDADALEIRIIENVQREDLNRWKRAGLFTRSRTNSNAARRHRQDRRKSRSHVANMMRLTNCRRRCRPISKGELSPATPAL